MKLKDSMSAFPGKKSEPSRKIRETRRCGCHAVRKGQAFLMQEVTECLRDALSRPQILDLDATHKGEIGDCGASYDLIYTAEFFISLRLVEAHKEVRRLVSRLNPGGRLLIVNPSRDALHTKCPGCCQLLQQGSTEEEMAQFTREVPETDIAGQVFFRNSTRTSILLEVHKTVAPRFEAAALERPQQNT